MENVSFNIEQIEKIIEYTFKDKKLLKMAFTHSSYANEHKCKSNERLEFFGDSVLGFVVTKKLYSDFKLNEGNLSKFRQKLVSEQPLSFIVKFFIFAPHTSQYFLNLFVHYKVLMLLPYIHLICQSGDNYKCRHNLQLYGLAFLFH